LLLKWVEGAEMPKKKKKESWKEKRQRAALKQQKALEAERLRREAEPKKDKGWSSSRVVGIGILVVLLLVVGVYAVLQNTQPASNGNGGLPALYTLTDADFSEFRGKVVVVDCFATWCQPCLQEIPHLAQIYEDYSSSEVVVVSVGSSGDSETGLRQFKKDYGMSWIVARDTVGVFDKYNVQYIPTLVIIDQDGAIDFRNEGLTDASVLSSSIDALLGS
jgi:thiol-disulfide isomerase/thioredoxin